MPPLLSSGYTFSAFLERLERSALPYIAPLYHDNQLLFTKRPDMFDKAILSISWERGLELLRAAYYVQPIELQTYRALLARMLLHNQQVRCRHAGEYVHWRAALRVYEEAIITHGLKVPSVMTRSILRLLAPHRRANEAVALLKLAQANDKMTKLLLIEAARVCATKDKWPVALSFLMHVHDQEPSLLYNTIQSLRPVNTNLLASDDTARYSLLPCDLRKNKADNTICVDNEQICESHNEVNDDHSGDGNGESQTYGPNARQRHIIHILNDIISVIPPSVSLTNPLCRSYLTHLIASTTLDANEKTELLLHVLGPFSWETTLHLLTTYTEPNLLSSSDWAEMTQSEVAEPSSLQADSANSDNKEKYQRKKLEKGKPLTERELKTKKKRKKKTTPTTMTMMNRVNANGAIKRKSVKTNDMMLADVHSLTKELPWRSSSNRSNNNSNSKVDVVDNKEKNSIENINNVDYQTLFQCLHSRLQWLRSAHAASMMAVMITKFPTPLMALEFVKSCNDYLNNRNNEINMCSSNIEESIEGKNGDNNAINNNIDSNKNINICVGNNNDEFNADKELKTSSSHSCSNVIRHNDNSMVNNSLITRDPVVIHALLETCTCTLPQTKRRQHHSTSHANTHHTADNNNKCSNNITDTNNKNVKNAICGKDKEKMSWQVASRILLEWSGPYVPTATDILSNIIMQLRSAKQTTLMIRILNEHIVPSHSMLDKQALLAMMEAILAHNRAVHLAEMQLREEYNLISNDNNLVMTTCNHSASTCTYDKTNQLKQILHEQLPAEVHWKSALSWALDLQAEEVQQHQIVESGTGPSAGAVSRRPATAVKIDKTLPPELLNILLCICVEAGSAKAALRALGYARRVGKVELFLSSEIRALLYCILYNRPNEAIAIVTHAETKWGHTVAIPIRKLLMLAQHQKKLERLRNEFADRKSIVKHVNERVESELIKTKITKTTDNISNNTLHAKCPKKQQQQQQHLTLSDLKNVFLHVRVIYFYVDC